MKDLPLFDTSQFEIYLQNFFEQSGEFSASLLSYSEGLLKEISHNLKGIPEKINEFKDEMGNVLNLARNLVKNVGREGFHLDKAEIDEKLRVELGILLERIKQDFPPPDEAQNHAQRLQHFSKILDDVEDILVRINLPEDQTRTIFREMKPSMLSILTLFGDITEQHPHLMEVLLFTGAVMLIPEEWLLSPIFSLFGFGPYGPVKGSSAAWMQRTFWGAAVSRGSWFAHLQRAGMMLKAPSVVESIFGAVGVGLGIAGGILHNAADVSSSTETRVPDSNVKAKL